MSSAHYRRQFASANRKGWPKAMKHLRGVLKKSNYRKRDINGKRNIDRW